MPLPLFTLKQLQNPNTAAQCEAQMLDKLTQLKFNATSWKDGSVQLTLIKTFAYIYSLALGAVSALSMQGFNATATAEYLDEFSRSNYNNERLPSEVTEGWFKLTVVDGDVAQLPTNLAIGELLVADNDTTNPHVFRNTEAVSIVGTTTYIKMQAEETGSGYNLIYDSNLKFVSPAMLGFIVQNPRDYWDGSQTNPIPANDDDYNLLNGWITQVGADEESDDALRARNTAKWGTVTSINNDGGLEYYVRKVSSKITKVLIDGYQPRGVNTIDVYIASDSGIIPSSDQAFIDAQETCNLHKMITTDVLVKEVENQNITINISVILARGFNNAQSRETIIRNVQNYISSFPIGGGTIGKVVFSKVVSLVQNSLGTDPYGVLSATVTINGSSADLSILPEKIITATVNYTAVEG